MGQHYYIVNPKKRQYMCPKKFGDGRRLREFASSGCGTLLGLTILLADGNGRGEGDHPSENKLIGSWAGDPIVIAGDYAEDGTHVPEADVVAYRAAISADPDVVEYMRAKGKRIEDVVPNLYKVATHCYTDISDDVILAACDGPYERQALIARGAEAANRWVPPPPKVDPFSLE